MNKEISKIFNDIVNLLEIKGETFFRINAYKKAIKSLDNLQQDVADIYKKRNIKGLKEIPGIGKSIALKIEEYIKSANRYAKKVKMKPDVEAQNIKSNHQSSFVPEAESSTKNPDVLNVNIESFGARIKYYDNLKKETAIRQIITYFFESKGLSLQELKENAKKKKIIYSRFTKPAKQLLDLAGSTKKAKEAIYKVSRWANSRKLDYAIETVFKKWLELDKLKPKEIVKKPFYKGDPMVWSESKKKWFVISKYGEWLEFADKESMIEWKIIN